MKNIHVLQTDKPTRLFTSDSELILAGYPATTFKTGKNIYITSNEALPYDSSIFDNGAFYHRDAVGDVHIITKHTFKPNPHFCKRIILTTDGDLIKEGVQAIDDEFLEWFVQNPSCEEVEVEDYNSYGVDNWKYLITIPKEEPKQHYEDIHEDNVEKWRNKQETLEEVALKLYPRLINDSYNPLEDDNKESRDIWINGAKWQQNRSYSEEEALRIIQECKSYLSFGDEFNEIEWFEQFKKK